jgi:hypothetical protein
MRFPLDDVSERLAANERRRAANARGQEVLDAFQADAVRHAEQGVPLNLYFVRRDDMDAIEAMVGPDDRPLIAKPVRFFGPLGECEVRVLREGAKR